MRRIINSTYVSLDGVVQRPELWTFDYRSDDAARADAADQLRKLKQQSGQDILQYGYGQVTATLMREGMLDELRIWLHPLLVGGSDPQALLAHVGVHARLALADVTPYDSGLVILRYRPSNGSPNPDEPA